MDICECWRGVRGTNNHHETRARLGHSVVHPNLDAIGCAALIDGGSPYQLALLRDRHSLRTACQAERQLLRGQIGVLSFQQDHQGLPGIQRLIVDASQARSLINLVDGHLELNRDDHQSIAHGQPDRLSLATGFLTGHPGNLPVERNSQSRWATDQAEHQSLLRFVGVGRDHCEGQRLAFIEGLLGDRCHLRRCIHLIDHQLELRCHGLNAVRNAELHRLGLAAEVFTGDPAHLACG